MRQTEHSSVSSIDRDRQSHVKNGVESLARNYGAEKHKQHRRNKGDLQFKVLIDENINRQGCIYGSEVCKGHLDIKFAPTLVS